MAFTKQQVFTFISTVYLLGITAVAAYSIHAIRSHSLPIPTALGVLVLVLPLLSGISISSSAQFVQRRQKQIQGHQANPLPTESPLCSSNTAHLTFLPLLVFETVLVTLAGTHLAPASSLDCGLDQTWQRLFHLKDGNAVRRIQDAVECCGLHSTVDRAWPFPGHDNDIHACGNRYQRDDSCAGPWKSEERKIAGVLVLVVVLTFVWKAIVLGSLSGRVPWLQRVHLRGRRRRQNALGYEGERYLDDPIQEIEDGDESSGGTRAIEDGEQRRAPRSIGLEPENLAPATRNPDM